MRMRPALAVAVLAPALALAVAACSPEDDGGTSSTGGPTATGASAAAIDPATCAAGKTLTDGKLTFATDQPVYEPWFVDDKPENGKGFEGAVAAAIATKLGFAPADVVWKRVTFNNAIAPGPKTFDADINEFSISDERRQNIDFSSPYYDVRQTVIALKGNKAASATSLAALKDVQLGAQVGTTSYDAATALDSAKKPRVYNSNDDALAALKNGQIDGLVVDLPTAFYMTSAQLDDGVIVGQLPQPGGTPEQFGLVLDKGSAFTPCLSAAVDALRADGTLAALEKQWLSSEGNAPELS